MKKTFVFAMIIGMLVSCSKQSDIVDIKNLIGEWRWVKSTGGISGDIVTPESTGNQIMLEISEDSYKKFINGTLELELSYYLIIGQSIWTPVPKNIFVFEDESKQSIDLSGNELILYEECYDCFQHEYIRN
jgi:hypothetical protein